MPITRKNYLMSNNKLIVFAKSPVKGKVKTRLIPELGPGPALEAHIQMVEDTLEMAKGSGLPLTLWLSEPNLLGEQWGDQYSIPIRIQQGGDLGIRMLDAISRTIKNRHDKVVLIGSDCPSLQKEDIIFAFLSLEQNDVTLCPSEDGGYGLIGMKKAHTGIFSNIAWGSPIVMKETLRQINSSGLSVEIGRTIWDVDDYEGWQRYLRWRKLR